MGIWLENVYSKNVVHETCCQTSFYINLFNEIKLIFTSFANEESSRNLFNLFSTLMKFQGRT